MKSRGGGQDPPDRLAALPLFHPDDATAGVNAAAPWLAAVPASRVHDTGGPSRPQDVTPPRRAPRGPAPKPDGPVAARLRQPGVAVDWAQVRAFRQQAAELLTAQLRDRAGLDEAARREIGRALIVSMLRDHADSLLAEGVAPPAPAEEHALAGAIFDALFRLGRLQPLVDDPDVENIEITGCDQVYMIYGDRRPELGPPVADSDEELIETIAFLAARSGGGQRTFSPANPLLDLALGVDVRARLAARAWITPRPKVVIRKHKLVDVDLEDLRELGMLDEALCAFLSAAVRAHKSVVVAGEMGAGKTTLVRALCNEIDPWEHLGTIETEYELYLHAMPIERHRRVTAQEARPGTGERGPGGTAAGEITLVALLEAALRMNLDRIIVGEVRGREILAMFEAMQTCSGSLSTTHAHNARAAIERLVTCALAAGPQVTEALAYRQIAHHIDLIVHVGMDDRTQSGGGIRRFVSEVIEVNTGEHQQIVAVSDIFKAHPDGRSFPTPYTPPSFLSDLERVGFDPAWLRPVGIGGRPVRS